MNDQDPLSGFHESESIARKAYFRLARKNIGITYLVVSTYVPLIYVLSIIYLDFSERSPFLSQIAWELTHSPFIYITYMLIVYILIYRLKKIPLVLERIQEIKKRESPKRLRKVSRLLVLSFSPLTYLPTLIYLVVVLALLDVLPLNKELSNIIGNIVNLSILILILLYFHKIFSQLNVDKPRVEDFVAIAGAIVGFIGGIFNPYFFFVFSFSWMVAGLSIVRKFW
ncbi:hypothetical protein [Sulfuracidifex metallicus]|uniref:hypothetical protein n=1 Tax=Sulfuracidifex metallicus TaxID=47303 RepID=UPI002276FB79|nr:hypothetical protein [Sulfuracidifex metallicus]MCY0849838.1 hypothetical protein [Sulfuracidifex metallicus]